MKKLPELDGPDPSAVTVSSDRARGCFVILSVDAHEPDPMASTGQSIGVDLDLLDFLVLSRGEPVARTCDARVDILHTASTDLVRRFERIAVEELAVPGVVENRKRAEAIGGSGWGQFRAPLTYQAQGCGATLAVVDRHLYPSSKTCSGSGHLLPSLSLATRPWTCPGCGTRHHGDIHDRDVNAAKNIAAAAGPAADVRGGDESRQGSALRC